MGACLPVSALTCAAGFDVQAYWEEDAQGVHLITRISLAGDGIPVEAVQCILRAYGIDPHVSVTWEAGEGKNESVAFLRRPTRGEVDS